MLSSVTDPNQIDDDDTNIQQLQDWKKAAPLGKVHKLLRRRGSAALFLLCGERGKEQKLLKRDFTPN
jgi:hypothetical protein